MSARDDDQVRGFLVAGFSLLAVALLVGAYLLAFPPAKAPAPLQGPAAPPFSLERLQGGTVTLAELRGKIVVIDFWATWCPPCREEMPWLVKLGKDYESRGVVFVAISEDDPPGQIPLVTAFSREVPGLERFAVLGNPEIERIYGVTSLPTLFVVGREGQVLRRFVGSADESTVVELVESLADAR